jgi:Xaa-Pro aminopeptidase
MARRGVQAALITDKDNVRYYSGFLGTSSQLLITQREMWFFTDFRYTEQAEAETDFAVVETRGNTRIDEIFSTAKKAGVRQMGVDLGWVSYTAYTTYLEHAAPQDIVDLSADISVQRSIKDDEELALIARGARHNDKLFAHLCTLIRPGVSENDIKAEIVYYINKNGADIAFDPIVASGPNSSLPHATPSDRPFAPGDFVTMDYGCRFSGYCSDFTRTVAISDIDKAKQKVYDIVKCAGDSALCALAAGQQGKDIDAVARNVITEAGYAEAFGHGLGHGVGLFIHEAPTLNALSDVALEENMVVTVEPGIYLKGQFGVRIEDLCVVKDGGHVNLTAAPRDMIIL